MDNVRAFAYHPGAISTDILGALPEGARGLFTDSLQLPAGFTLWLATQKESDFLRGKFASANWVSAFDVIVLNVVLIEYMLSGCR